MHLIYTLLQYPTNVIDGLITQVKWKIFLDMRRVSTKHFPYFFLDRPVLLYLKKKINRPKTRGNYKQGDYKVSQTRPPLGLGMTHIGQTLQKKI